jgi:hypothetical protein
MTSWPVMNAAPGELSQSTVLAIPSRVPMRQPGFVSQSFSSRRSRLPKLRYLRASRRENLIPVVMVEFQQRYGKRHGGFARADTFVVIGNRQVDERRYAAPGIEENTEDPLIPNCLVLSAEIRAFCDFGIQSF